MHSIPHCAEWRNDMDPVLEVKHLKVSFRTSGGVLKAVRDISFSLERGRTLAVVGESGSGKSVTSKAILGILAGNSIIEGGEILYDGRDLLKICEEEMCKIRGDRIAMIFQDPLSSLNPIVKIGSQITEAMLLKNKISRKAARRDFNSTLALLKKNMIAACGDEAGVSGMIEIFKKSCMEAVRMENDFNSAFAAAECLASDMEEFLFLTEKKQKVDGKAKLREFADTLGAVRKPFLTQGDDERLASLASELASAREGYRDDDDAHRDDIVSPVLRKITALLGKITAGTRPDFFAVSYFKLKNPETDFSAEKMEELNERMLAYLEGNFMSEFLALAEKGIRHSFGQVLVKKKDVLAELKSVRDFYKTIRYDKAEALSKAREISDAVEDSIDRMEAVTDSTAYAFRSSLTAAVEKYFEAVSGNICDHDELQAAIVKVCDDLVGRYESCIEKAESGDFSARTAALIDYFRKKAFESGYRVTKKMAKEKAVRLMEEVGIPEPHIRFYRYPFEFSGGMRQRIVIAIALAADPDILICDEPTTALDVTIQAQILELIDKLKAERGLSVIFITHDLGVVARMADEIAVMYAGRIVEYGTAEDVFYDPRHPYTWALLSSMPDLETSEKLEAIPGTPPNMIHPPVGDAFADRNRYAMKIDFEMQPPEFAVSDTHRASAWLLHPDAPKIGKPKIIAERIERMKRKEEMDNEQRGEL